MENYQEDTSGGRGSCWVLADGRWQPRLVTHHLGKVVEDRRDDTEAQRSGPRRGECSEEPEQGLFKERIFVPKLLGLREAGFPPEHIYGPPAEPCRHWELSRAHDQGGPRSSAEGSAWGDR